MNKSEKRIVRLLNKIREHAFIISHLRLTPDTWIRGRDAEHHSSFAFRNVFENGREGDSPCRCQDVWSRFDIDPLFLSLSLSVFTEKPRSVASNWPIIQFDLYTIMQLIVARYQRAMHLLYFIRGIGSSIDPFEFPGGKRRSINSALLQLVFKAKALWKS